jgi:hypothetical protein
VVEIEPNNHSSK